VRIEELLEAGNPAVNTKESAFLLVDRLVVKDFDEDDRTV
jgi:hypothetical protein